MMMFKKTRISLTIRVSILLILAVVVPLLITVIGSALILRPTLLSQASTEMGNDAQSHAQAIDSLLIARMQDLGFVGQFFAIQKFLSGDGVYKQQALDELTLGHNLDPNYGTWTLFDVQGKIRLSSPALPLPRGKYNIAPEILKQMQAVHKTLISDVYFDTTTHMAFIDMYASIASTNGALLGIGRATLQMNDIWTAVNNETNAAPGSFAMVVDGHGVRIAYTNVDTTLTTEPPQLFTAVAELSPQFQQRIRDENLYGSARTTVKALPDPVLANQLQDTQEGSSTFQLTPALQGEQFQAYRATSQVVPWTYLVLRPVSTITKAADQQDIYLILIAAFVTILAAFVGIVVGRGITRPILGSVSSLLGSSQMLKTLADREEITAKEQKWIVESSQTGLKSVQYYVNASSIAARKMGEIGKDLAQNWQRVDEQHIKQRLDEIIATANYIEKASGHQENSSKSVATAVRITTQVTEQLIAGATSANDAATQLEEVIKQLRQVVGE